MQQPLFFVPTSLLRALNCDLAAAGIPKKDHRGRTIDVHAMRTTLATMLNKSGVAPRTAQEIMRHSDIRLTMEIYTDAKLLNVSGALDQLPDLSSTSSTEVEPNVMQATGTEAVLPPILPPNTVQGGLSESSTVTLTGNFGIQSPESSASESDEKPTKKGLSEGNSDKPSESGRQDLNLRPLHPQCSSLEFEGVETTEVTTTRSDASANASPSQSKTDSETDTDSTTEPDFVSSIVGIMSLPLSDEEKAEAVRRLLAARFI